MASVNALRGVLVAGAAAAGLLAVVAGRWSVAVLMIVAVGVHGLGTMWLRQHKARADVAPPPESASADAGPG